MPHGPSLVLPSVEKPSIHHSLSGSAQPAPLALRRRPVAGLVAGVLPRYSVGRPASSAQLNVFDVPSVIWPILTLGRSLKKGGFIAVVKEEIVLIGRRAPVYWE